ncbi:hypothetical protein [Streptomyces tubercidicus]|uniref:hypothetical protein n=1 Tax=Streptomyces tubercidicus TaxID=47759 RepID=UPI0036C5A821
MTEIFFADVSDVQAHMSAIPSKWRECRLDRHILRKVDAGRYPDGDYWRVRECRRCHTRRWDDIDAEGYIIQKSYKYPDGYQLEPGSGRMGADSRAAERMADLQGDIAKANGQHLRSVS